MRVLIVDDHDLVRDALAAYISRLEPTFDVVPASSLPEAIEIAGREGPFGVAVLDLNMPGMEGAGGIGRFREASPDTPVVLMSGQAARDEVEMAMDLGARGYLPKTLNAPAFVSALKLVLAGEIFLPYGALDKTEPAAGSGLPTFTRREGDVLGALVRGCSNKEIARELDLQEVTIKLHVKNICRKLSARNRTEAALRAVQLGWKP